MGKRVRQDFLCPHCGASFSRRERLERHVNAHTGARPFKCQEAGCDAAFNRSDHLKRHMSTHTGAKALRCERPGCTASFYEHTHAKRHADWHARVDAGEATEYPCTICPRVEVAPFSRKHLLQAHMEAVHPEAHLSVKSTRKRPRKEAEVAAAVDEEHGVQRHPAPRPIKRQGAAVKRGRSGLLPLPARSDEESDRDDHDEHGDDVDDADAGWGGVDEDEAPEVVDFAVLQVAAPEAASVLLHTCPYTATGCIKQFKYTADLKRHARSEHSRVPLPCSGCAKVFKSFSAYWTHARDCAALRGLGVPVPATRAKRTVRAKPQRPPLRVPVAPPLPSNDSMAAYMKAMHTVGRATVPVVAAPAESPGMSSLLTFGMMIRPPARVRSASPAATMTAAVRGVPLRPPSVLGLVVAASTSGESSGSLLRGRPRGLSGASMASMFNPAGDDAGSDTDEGVEDWHSVGEASQRRRLYGASPEDFYNDMEALQGQGYVDDEE